MPLLPPAPDCLLKLISCNCSKSCNPKRCSCIKAGSRCSSLCGFCQGMGCENAIPVNCRGEDYLQGEENEEKDSDSESLLEFDDEKKNAFIR